MRIPGESLTRYRQPCHVTNHFQCPRGLATSVIYTLPTGKWLRMIWDPWVDFSNSGADSRKGVPGERPPPPLKFSKIRELWDIYKYIYIMTNMHLSRSILMSQLFTCLSLAILILSCRICSVAMIFRSG